MRKLLRTILAGTRLLVGLALIALAAPALADDAADRAALDTLFAELRVAPDAATAKEIDRQIWAYWTRPSDPVLAGRMSEILVARSLGHLPTAIALLDKLVADYPDYAEGWNQRATLYYMLGDFDRSIADCGKVLALEPRHFGALSGLAFMLESMDEPELALEALRMVQELNPNRPNIADAVKRLEQTSGEADL